MASMDDTSHTFTEVQTVYRVAKIRLLAELNMFTLAIQHLYLDYDQQIQLKPFS